MRTGRLPVLRAGHFLAALALFVLALLQDLVFFLDMLLLQDLVVDMHLQGALLRCDGFCQQLAPS